MQTSEEQGADSPGLHAGATKVKVALRIRPLIARDNGPDCQIAIAPEGTRAVGGFECR